MPDKARLLARVENAAQTLARVWPLQTFIAANPLAGFEDRPFADAAREGQRRFGGRGWPTRAMGQAALARGAIRADLLKSVLVRQDCADRYRAMTEEPDPDFCMPANPRAKGADQSPDSILNVLMIRYLSVFLDRGQAAWPMPGRGRGFYRCWRDLAPSDCTLPNRAFLGALPDTAIDALYFLVRDVPEDAQEDLFAHHLAALPGWGGFVKKYAHSRTGHDAAPITMVDLLAVRLAMAHMLGHDIAVVPTGADSKDTEHAEGALWLEAWEETYRTDLLTQLGACDDFRSESPQRFDAQFVFCIDVRSEVFRRHLEQTGNYDTYGFAGFFGVPIRHTPFTGAPVTDSCPVLLTPSYTTTEQPCQGCDVQAHRHQNGYNTLHSMDHGIADLKNDLTAPLTGVEALGPLCAIGIALRTMMPKTTKTLARTLRDWIMPPVMLEPVIAKTEHSSCGLSLAERVFHAEAALRIMGLTDHFAPYVVLAGHGGETVNNPYASGLDCGACGGNHGGPNARIMAAIFNDPAVRDGLRSRGIAIPESTVFVPALHNTTTDDCVFLDPNITIPAALKDDLLKAKRAANAERCATFATAADPAHRAADWAEVRPEWGLARNAAFIVGPRSMTRAINLSGRTFLHSYDWEQDPDGTSLTIILTAPMVVAQWINSQYYFSTVDNSVYGSGSKTTHNVVGTVGVMQGNGSDLMHGLPMQSVFANDANVYHEPLRLMTVVKAPLARVSTIIGANTILQTLFDHEWVALTVSDPHTDRFMRYRPGKRWVAFDLFAPATAVPVSPVVPAATRPASTQGQLNQVYETVL